MAATASSRRPVASEQGRAVAEPGAAGPAPMDVADQTVDQTPVPNSDAHEYTALVRPRDPVLARDARPFAAEPGARATTLEWPLPRTFAGALRAWYRARVHDGQSFDKSGNIAVHGPLLAARHQHAADWQVYLPAPRDVVLYRDEVGSLADSSLKPKSELECMVLRPQAPGGGEGCTWPAQDGAGGRVALRPLSVDRDVKADSTVPRLWSFDAVTSWLNTPGRDKSTLPWAAPDEEGRQRLTGLNYPKNEARTHVAMDPATGTGRPGSLFTTEALAFRDEPGANGDGPAIALLGRVHSPVTWPKAALGGALPLGGERRVTSLEIRPTPNGARLWPAPSYPAPEQLTPDVGLCLYLATPAIFADGWLPGWVNDGAIPGTGGRRLGLTLAGAAVGRMVPVSGWAAAHETPNGTTLPAGPRKTRYAVPAGSIYFFEVNGGATLDAALIRELWDALWLRPVSDAELDGRAGFGLALPGLWAPKQA